MKALPPNVISAVVGLRDKPGGWLALKRFVTDNDLTDVEPMNRLIAAIDAALDGDEAPLLAWINEARGES